MTTGTDAQTRRREIAANLERVEARIQAACDAAGRPRGDVTLVAVTKTFPASDVGHLAALGVLDVGENRDADAAAKVRECAAEGVTGLVWHFVGQVQRNKARSIATYADVVHSVDRHRLVGALEKGAAAAGREVTCLVQVDLREPPVEDGRGGAAPVDVPGVAAAVADAGHLRLGGVMAVAPLGLDAAGTDAAFDRLAAASRRLREAHPEAVVVSAGMSADLEAAVAHGATHLRVGTALLGSRPLNG